MSTASEAFYKTLEQALPLLRELTEAQSEEPFAPDKWSPKQVIGHLTDSASNNHQRFVRARFQNDLVFPGYGVSSSSYIIG